jgi:hypothetical protein
MNQSDRHREHRDLIKSSVPAVWRKQCGVTRFSFNAGHLSLATATCFANRYCTPSGLSLVPLAFGKTIWPSPRLGCWNQSFSGAH